MTDLDYFNFNRFERIELLIEERLGDIAERVYVVESANPGYLCVYFNAVNGRVAFYYIPSLTPTNEQISEAIETLRLGYLFPE